MLNELRSDLGPAFGFPTSEEGRQTRDRVRQPVGEDDDDEEYAMAAAYMSHTVDYHDGIAEPRSYAEVVKSPQADEWKKAILAELDAIHKQEVFEEIDYLPDPNNDKAIGLYLVFKAKRDSDGQVVRYKSYAPATRMRHRYQTSTEARPSAFLPDDWPRGSHPNQTHWRVRGGTRKATGLGGVPDGYWPGGVWEGVVCGFSPLAVGVQWFGGALAWRFLVLFVLSLSFFSRSGFCS
jgi:hypothetical protein